MFVIQKATRKPSMQAAIWRLRLYVTALVISIGLYLAMHGTSEIWFIALCVLAMIAVGGWQLYGPMLPIGASLALVIAVFHPAVSTAMAEQRSLASLLGSTEIWPQMLVAIFSGRVLSCHQDLCFQRFWQDPLSATLSVSIQSFPAAAALGVFLTLLHYTLISSLSFDIAVDAPSIMISALLGDTFIHTLIIYLFFVVIAFLAEGMWSYRSDRLALREMRNFLKGRRDQFSRAGDPGLATAFPALGHRRVMRLLSAAIDLKGAQDKAKIELATLSFDTFHRASRQFIRTLIPFLTLLGFLGTVIGLAGAVSGLPGNLAPGQGGTDVSVSLAGLAVKFETTLLGLVATMVTSLLLNLLEKQEHQLAAECLLVIHEQSLDNAQAV